MAIKLGGDTNITLTNTSFSCSTGGGDPAMIVSLFTVASAGNYHFEGNFTGNSTMTVALSINGTNKEIWIVIGAQNQTYDFTAEVGDVITLEAAGSGSGSNLSVVRYADEIKEIYVGEGTLVDDYSAMRGPCPVGYHVPLISEWTALCGILTTTLGLDNNSTTLKTYLKMPNHGYRSESSSNVVNTTYCYYWSSSRNSDYGAGGVYATGSAINLGTYHYRSRGFNVRGFKDDFVAPDSNWTTLYDGSSVAVGAGIFYNSTLGLISVSGDGTNWITISDKNLGATTVYNNGDTVSSSNSGGFFQWGNNYMFPFSGSVTTSSVKVNASDYGPGNYYSSDVFITPSSTPKRREDPENKNLRGGVTGIQQKQAGNVTEVYVGTTKVRPLTN